MRETQDLPRSRSGADFTELSHAFGFCLKEFREGHWLEWADDFWNSVPEDSSHMKECLELMREGKLENMPIFGDNGRPGEPGGVCEHLGRFETIEEQLLFLPSRAEIQQRLNHVAKTIQCGRTSSSVQL